VYSNIAQAVALGIKGLTSIHIITDLTAFSSMILIHNIVNLPLMNQEEYLLLHSDHCKNQQVQAEEVKV